MTRIHKGYRKLVEPSPGNKICNTCHEEKPLSAFNAEVYNSNGSVASDCRDCDNETERSRRANKHPEFDSFMKALREKHRGKK